jgi:hypothetical protein
MSMRTFRSKETDWTVFEVRRQVSAKTGWAYLPGGYSDGWLCFESATAKRRLAQYPDRWREFSDAELEQLLGQALPAPLPAFRLGDDYGDTSADLRAE